MILTARLGLRNSLHTKSINLFCCPHGLLGLPRHQVYGRNAKMCRGERVARIVFGQNAFSMCKFLSRLLRNSGASWPSWTKSPRWSTNRDGMYGMSSRSFPPSFTGSSMLKQAPHNLPSCACLRQVGVHARPWSEMQAVLRRSERLGCREGNGRKANRPSLISCRPACTAADSSLELVSLSTKAPAGRSRHEIGSERQRCCHSFRRDP